MDQELRERVERLEAGLDEVQRRLDDELAREARRRRRASWLRLAAVLVLAALYALYFRGLTGF